MKRYLPLILAGIFVISGCTIVSKKRVDQGMEGNAGYVMGAPEETNATAKDSHRIVEVQAPSNPIEPIYNAVNKVVTNVDQWFERHFW